MLPFGNKLLKHNEITACDRLKSTTAGRAGCVSSTSSRKKKGDRQRRGGRQEEVRARETTALPLSHARSYAFGKVRRALASQLLKLQFHLHIH